MLTTKCAFMCQQPSALHMSTSFKSFLRAGHGPTLFAAFLYFAFSCCIWVLNGAMAPFISETFSLSPAQKGLMLSVPIIAGALMRFPLGVLAQYIGRKRATLVEMGLIAVAMLFGFFFVHSFNELLAMGVLLGIAGASFGVALSLGAGWFPPLMMNAGAGPPLASFGCAGNEAPLHVPAMATE
jgi:NNP family nitrate/nitrite transporter-like MFS transporter